MKRPAGLTIIELLIAAVILLVILGLVAIGISSGSTAVTTVVTNASLTEDTRVAGQMIADGVAKAIYVFPPGAKLILANSYSTRRPGTAASVWTVGSDPILAYIESPENPARACTTTGSDRSGCLHFVAYYPIERKRLVERRAYFRDDRNAAAWTLMEYRISLDHGLGRLTKPLLTYEGSYARVLADFVVPETGFVPFTGPTTCRESENDGLIMQTDASACSDLKARYDANYLNTTVSTQFELQTEYKNRVGHSMTPLMTFSVAPRNLVNLSDLD